MQQPVCEDVTISILSEHGSMEEPRQRECNVKLALASEDTQQGVKGRYFRVRLLESMHARWTVFEIWLRGCRNCESSESK